MTSQDLEKLPYRENVGIMLINDQNMVFVGQRLDNYQDAWQMPQGGIDSGENAEDAAFRELEEETGIVKNLAQIEAVSKDWITYDLPTELISKLWKGRYRGQKQKWFLMRFRGSNKQVNIETSHPEFADWKWVVVSELEENIVEFKKAVYRQVIKEFKSHF
ncbi:MAG: RNA pyrophosphohydrolase [Paracoccaceae bacterium]|nr:RNA pyrophosphohydrolase [Paracoccaceae bacterium]